MVFDNMNQAGYGVGSYKGRHADLYDVFYSEKPYTAEADFIYSCFKKYGNGPLNRLLELACGTGTHAFELEKKGVLVTALDYSEDMIRCAREKALNNHSNVDFHREDMRSFVFAPPSFDGVYCLFDSIGYVSTNDSVIRVIQNVSKHLRPGGIFIFEFWHAAAMILHHESMRTREWNTPKGKILRISNTTLNYQQQTADVEYSIYELNHDGTYSFLQETQTNRFFSQGEMELLLLKGGLTPLKWLNGFSEDERITDETWHIVALAKKEN